MSQAELLSLTTGLVGFNGFVSFLVDTHETHSSVH